MSFQCASAAGPTSSEGGIGLELIPGDSKQAVAGARHPGGGYVLTAVCRAQLLLYCIGLGKPEATANSMATHQTNGRILVAGVLMKYDVSEVRLESVETDAESQELIELPMDALSQVGGGGVVLNE